MDAPAGLLLIGRGAGKFRPTTRRAGELWPLQSPNRFTTFCVVGSSERIRNHAPALLAAFHLAALQLCHRLGWSVIVLSRASDRVAALPSLPPAFARQSTRISPVRFCRVRRRPRSALRNYPRPGDRTLRGELWPSHLFHLHIHNRVNGILTDQARLKSPGFLSGRLE